jgi:ferritin-like metal-binding protein YciE
MEGILKRTMTLINKTDQGIVRDACLIAAEQKIKHYEIASYGTLHAYAKQWEKLKRPSYSLTLMKKKSRCNTN